VATNPSPKQIGAYSISNNPNTMKEVAAVKLVKRIMLAEEAEATAG
jgi:hypothetical protein